MRLISSLLFILPLYKYHEILKKSTYAKSGRIDDVDSLVRVNFKKLKC